MSVKPEGLLGDIKCGGFRKNQYFWGYEDFVDIFFGWGGGVITKLEHTVAKIKNA